MDALKILEEKITSLVELINKLKTENAELKTENANLAQELAQVGEENSQLSSKLLAVEGSLQKDSHRLDELKQEKELTRIVVDDLIKSLDSLVESQS
jgi:predicted nuclease with TOPRIM domain